MSRLGRPVVGIDLRRNAWAPQYGISRYARNLLIAMHALAPPDLDVVPIDIAGSGVWDPGPVLRTRPRHSMTARMLQEQVDMRRMRRRLDLIHLPWYEGPLMPATPHVVSVLDLDTIDGRATYNWRFRAYYNTLLRAYLRTARIIITPSQATTDALRERWPRPRYVTVPLGVDPIFSPDREPLRIAGEQRVVLYTGGYGPRKRIDDLLTAFGHIAKAHGDVDLVLSGAAPVEFLDAIARSSHPDRVHVTGYLTDAQMADLYVRASVVLYPTTLEGFGFPVVEAFASGTPVVATSVGSIPEIAGDVAWLVPMGDAQALTTAALTVLEDEAAAARMRAAGLARALTFDWASTAALTLDAYRAAM